MIEGIFLGGKEMGTHIKPSLDISTNQRLNGIKPSSILAFNEQISSIPDIIKLTVGEPDFNTPEHVKAAGIRSIENNESHYTSSSGRLDLRKAMADFLAKKYDVHYDPEKEIVATAGATGGIFSSLTALLNPGDEVIIPVPTFPLYIPITIMNGATPVFLDTSQTDFILKAELLDQTLKNHPKTKAVVLNFPNNPTGTTFDEDELRALADVLKKYEVFVISDEIYSELTYDQTHVSLAKLLPEQTILLNGVSKSHAMTGWRVGILAAPKELIPKIAMVHQFTVTNVTANAQAAALEALSVGIDDAKAMNLAYKKRRDFLLPQLKAMGIETSEPKGAFYLFCKIPDRFELNSFDFCVKLANEAKVAVIPGSCFPCGEGYFRLSYAASFENLKEAMERLKSFMEVNQ